MTSDPDQIRGHIEETRTSLSQDVNTLADTVNPAHVAKRTAAGARSAVVGVKDKVMGAASQSASGMSSAAGEKVSAAQGQLRRQATGNPLAVGLIAVGVGWLVGHNVALAPGPAGHPGPVRCRVRTAPAVVGGHRGTDRLRGRVLHAAVETPVPGKHC